jgi:predicted CopG family antitoxin
VYIIYDMYKRITVGLRYDIYNRLRDKGKFGESFSDLINRLLTEIETIKAE